ncbi:MAG TPA: peroxiredoxin [Roseiflexaceae bacterium]|nr:peroxiredoxin [Roseiflexaceae bacterium]HMP41170.1 peroxiredoxin [Roseiflexaceae bacterium]
MQPSSFLSSSERDGVVVGDRAPDFTLPDHTGMLLTLSEQTRSGPTVLFFYPRANTLVCTAEVCAFRDRYAEFAEAGAHVIGISADPPAVNRAFHARFNLPFVLLSDSNNQVRSRYGALRAFGMIHSRATYVIDAQQIIRRIIVAQLDAERHVREALAQILAA